jgi:serine/threonine protein kinase
MLTGEAGCMHATEGRRKMSDLIDTQLGQYHLNSVIRRGGMSTVYKAYQASLDRYVAVKVLMHNRDPQFAARFKREARAIAQLQHPNILPIYDYGEQEGLLYLVLQYIENGVTLADMMGQSMALTEALRQTISLLNALDYAHQRSIIHRDIKPANVLMPAPTWPMLADFGIAKLLNDTDLRLTMPGLIVGTAAYMAPEQATGRPVDARTDIYATGVVLFEMVTGRVPFDADTPMAVLTKHAYEAPPPVRAFNPDLPPMIEAILLRAMAKDPNVRFQTAVEMAEELERAIVQLNQPQSRDQLDSLYQVGVQAFREGRWNMAVEQLNQLVMLDPEYEDANELLEAAREAQERAKAEARQQIELVRQRRQCGSHQRLQTSEAPVQAPINPRATHRLPSLPDLPPPTSNTAPSDARGSSTNASATPQPEAPRGAVTGKLQDLDAPSPRRNMLWVYIAVAVVAVLVLLFLFSRFLTGAAGLPASPALMSGVVIVWAGVRRLPEKREFEGLKQGSLDFTVLKKRGFEGVAPSVSAHPHCKVDRPCQEPCLNDLDRYSTTLSRPQPTTTSHDRRPKSSSESVGHER